MRRHQIFAGLGALLIVAGLFFIAQPTVLAQEDTEPTMFLQSFYDAWSSSGHADATAEAFIHWDADGVVEVACARCHSTTGYLDFLGADGSEAGTVENEAIAIGTTVNCDACHNSVTPTLSEVTFPSGMTVSDDGNSVRCMNCHQGRASGNSVRSRVETAGVTDPHTVSADLGFVNIHYYAAAATLYGSEAGGGYEFEGLVYQMRNEHVPGYQTCADCHNPHTLEVNIDACETCHEVADIEEVREIRMQGSLVDYDGDGSTREGISEEISTLQEMLYATIQTYATEVAGTPLVYSSSAYPYFFIDTNANGEGDEDELTNANKYVSFTPALLQAAYNYQVTLKDPGGYAHNPLYQIQLLFDSISALNTGLGEPTDLTNASRTDIGHFDVTGEPFRHWDADGEVPGTCARCHTAEGLPFYLEHGVNIASEPSNSLNCATCHDNLTEFSIYTVDEVTFPSGSVVSFGEGNESNLCLNCHQGRESTVSVNRAITSAGVGDDEVAERLTFRNIHYFAAGATMFGSEAQGAYQFADREYNGRNLHAEDMQTCTDCHNQHTTLNRLNSCADCHDGVETSEDVRNIRQEAEDVAGVDYDGDGDVTEPIREEIATLEDALLVALQAYATNTIGTSIAYDSHSHPYWFIDTNGNGVADEEEVNGDNRFASWTPNLLRAAFNYQYIQKDPGVFAHNPDYALQVLFDSLEAVGGADAVATFTRPPVVVAEAE